MSYMSMRYSLEGASYDLWGVGDWTLKVVGFHLDSYRRWVGAQMRGWFDR